MKPHFTDKTLLRFLAVGVLNTLLGSAVMFGLYNLAGLSYWLSSAANYSLVSVFSFLANRRFTFRSRTGLASGGLRFALNIGACYLLAYGMAKPLAAALLSGQGRTLRENAAMAAGMCFFTVLNYAGQRWFVFGKRAEEKPEKGMDPQDEMRIK